MVHQDLDVVDSPVLRVLGLQRADNAHLGYGRDECDGQRFYPVLSRLSLEFSTNFWSVLLKVVSASQSDSVFSVFSPSVLLSKKVSSRAFWLGVTRAEHSAAIDSNSARDRMVRRDEQS